MDLYAYMLTTDKLIDKYINENYGDIPRLRGVRFMKVEVPCGDDVDEDEREMFNKYVGQDVIYIHTRCGNCGYDYDNPDSNYVYCGAKDWEEKYSDLFLDHVTEGFDETYCTHYFKAVVNETYNKILVLLKGGEENNGQ